MTRTISSAAIRIFRLQRNNAGRLAEFHRAGVRHVVLDFVGPMAERDAQIERFADEVRPLVAALSSSIHQCQNP